MPLTKRHLITFLLLFHLSISNAQVEIKIYSGIFDTPGLAVEYLANERIGIELAGSFRFKNTTNQFINSTVDNWQHDFFINGKFKRYTAKKNPNTGLYYGAYLRYWQDYSTVVNMDSWTPEQTSYAITNDSWISSRIHKASLGVLGGYKGFFGEHWVWEICLGAGASPGLYRGKEVRFNNTQRHTYGDEFFQGETYLSLLGHLSIGYRF
ncbi:MAG: hypothetical protein MI810_19160 [Flavobacteriales bacterium]|nr:hypothetical protein [Flavobacteriales bacterium]